MTCIKWRDQEVRNSIARAFCAMVVIVAVAIILPMAVIVSLPLHILLRLFGRQGFAQVSQDGGINYTVDMLGFRRRQ